MSDFVLTEFVTVQPGQPYRLLPFGRIVKGGRVRELTPELARQFNLPPFKPAVKLGSHDDPTPAGGHIIGLEVRDDGLYAIPEFNERGMQALVDGSFRYHSPEIIWPGGGLETSEGIIPGPLIVGDAFLHTPFLGEAAALYSYQEVTTMTDEMVQVPRGLWDRFTAWFDKRASDPDPVDAVPPAQPPENFAALQAERDEYKARVEAMEAEATKKARVDRYAAELKATKAEPTAEMLAGMTDEQAEWVLTQFKALSAQIDESHLTTPIGSEGEGADALSLHERVTAYAAEHKLSYPDAVTALAHATPELFK